MICVGTADSAIFSAMWTLLSEKSDVELKDTSMKLVALGVALLCLGICGLIEPFKDLHGCSCTQASSRRRTPSSRR